MRLFIAINFPNEIKALIAKVRDDLKTSADRGNFTFDANIHLTLVFIGECDTRQLQAIKSVIDDIPFSTFPLMLEKTGYFKRNGGDTWWVGLKESNPLSMLQADLAGRLNQKGFLIEDRKYTPHVTIGREVKMPAGFIKPEVQQAKFEVTSIELMKSERINGKLAYTPMYSKIAN